jgi:hypothetical protein
MYVSVMLWHWGKFISDFRRGTEDILEAPKTELGFITKNPYNESGITARNDFT